MHVEFYRMPTGCSYIPEQRSFRHTPRQDLPVSRASLVPLFMLLQPHWPSSSSLNTPSSFSPRAFSCASLLELSLTFYIHWINSSYPSKFGLNFLSPGLYSSKLSYCLRTHFILRNTYHQYLSLPICLCLPLFNVRLSTCMAALGG